MVKDIIEFYELDFKSMLHLSLELSVQVNKR